MIGDHASTCSSCLHAQVAVKEARPRTQAAMDPLLAVPRVPHVSLAGDLPEASGPGTLSSEPLLVQPEEVFLPSSRGEEGGVGSSPDRAVDVVRSCHAISISSSSFRVPPPCPSAGGCSCPAAAAAAVAGSCSGACLYGVLVLSEATRLC